MKKLWNLLVLVLAANFLVVVGFAGWIVKSNHVDKAKALAIREIVFPSTAPAATQPATATTRPASALDDLVARQSGRSAGEQVEFVQHTFDAQMVQLDRREREVRDLERQVELAKQRMAADRVALQKQADALKARDAQAAKLAGDQGFQDALQRYIAMPPKQVKQVFAALDDETVVNFLQAMEPKTAAKVMKEFKTDEEVARVQRFMEKMRLAQASIKG